MKAPVTISERDLHALLGILSDSQQASLPLAGLPWSMLSDLKDQIGCDGLSFVGRIPSTQAQPLLGKTNGTGERMLPRQPADLGELWLDDSEPQAVWLNQALPDCPMQCEADDHASAAEQDWECAACAYPDRTGDLRSVIKLSDFYTTRQLHSTGMYQGMRKSGIEHELILCLPNDRGRVWFWRGAGPDFSERERGLLALLRPHLFEAYLAAERRRARQAPAHQPALGTAKPGRRWVHQRPDRPPTGHLGGNSPHSPGEHLHQAARLQPDSCGHQRVPRWGQLPPLGPGARGARSLGSPANGIIASNSWSVRARKSHWSCVLSVRATLDPGPRYWDGGT